MRVLRGLERRLRRPSCLAMGVFDGVHIGHRAVIGAAVRAARATDRVPAVLTFEPHPDAVLQKGASPPLLTTTEEKLALLRGLEVHLTIVAPFDRQLAGMEAETFVRQVLTEQLRARCIVVGENWRFGAGGRGTAGLLNRLAARLGLRIAVVPSVYAGRRKVSSTRIRTLLLRGDAVAARHLIGRPYRLSGHVVAGRGIGRRLGFPTANLEVPGQKLIPADGIYACLAGRRRLWPAAAYIGSRPTFGSGGPRCIEVHVIAHRGSLDLLGRPLKVDLVARLRGDRRFPSPEALASQMARDCAEAERVLRPLQHEGHVLSCGIGSGADSSAQARQSLED